MTKKKSYPNKIGVVGRKPIEPTQKKKPVTVYLPQADIDLIGGIESARSVSLQALTNEVNQAKIK